MWPVHDSGGEIPPGISPHLEVLLKPGWVYHARKKRFLGEKDRVVAPGDDLPAGAKIVYKVPSLAKAKLESLSDDERDLARYVHVILPKGTDPEAYLAVVQDWICVEEVRLPPRVSLP